MPFNTLYNLMARRWMFLLCTETELSLSSSTSNQIDHHYKLRVNIFHATGLFYY